MIIYEGSCELFINQCSSKEKGFTISDIISESMYKYCIHVGEPETRSWQKSLPLLAQVLKDHEVAKEAEIGIEYRIKRNKWRIDAIICGLDQNDKESAVVIELKQWSFVDKTDKPNYVHTIGAGGIEDDYWHPSYQAANYVGIIKNFYEYVYTAPVSFASCSYLHNMDQANRVIIGDQEVYPLLKSSPIFLKEDEQKLAEFIKKYIKSPCKGLLSRIDRSEIRPSPMLSKLLRDAIEGKEFLSYSDEQADAVSTIVQMVRDSDRYGEKRTIIIRGRPGTGKSIVALNVLGQLVAPQHGEKILNAAYFTTNEAPRKYYSKKLIDDDYRKKAINQLFKSSATLANLPENAMACSLFDEAHRIYIWKWGRNIPKGINLLERCIKGSRVSVFFIDEDQAIMVDDYVTIDRIYKAADRCNSKVFEGPTLTTQFRVLGGHSYLETIRYILGYKDSVPEPKGFPDYHVKVFDKATDMREELRKMNDLFKDSRMVAGYTFEWVSRNDYDNSYDIILDNGNFKAKWNMNKDDYSWLYDKDSFEDVGSIHTCQGLDMQYCGVIIGNDLRYENDQIVYDQSKIAKSDNSSKIRTCKDKSKAEQLIRNTYNVLLTRGMRGTFIYCVDEGLRDYLKSFFPD